MKVRILGSGAGGGFPQWNCNCDNCGGYREGSIVATSRTQSSIAISANETDWILFNASPDIRQQILNTPALQPARGKRDTGIKAIVLADSQIDHTSGLLLLREGNCIDLHCTEQTYQDLSTHYPVLKVLNHYCKVRHHKIDLDLTPLDIAGFDTINILGIPLKSESPPYSPGRGKNIPGSNLGFFITNKITKKSLFYAPGLGKPTAEIMEYMQRSDVLLVDGTFWTSDEMITRGVGKKLALQMGHLQQSGPGGMIQIIGEYKNTRKILIHINNTNPILDENSAERGKLTELGIEVSYDGMEFSL